jgi:hypothetical protein
MPREAAAFDARRRAVHPLLHPYGTKAPASDRLSAADLALIGAYFLKD